MKKILATFVFLALVTIMMPLAADAQVRNARTRYVSNSSYTTQVYKKPSFYRRHRNVINIAAGTGAGALLGALIGGKRGAAIGALTGAGGSALYTYKIRPKRRRY
jgi:outer membrane lipoprotein SlyB